LKIFHKILVVEDDLANQHILEYYLKDYNYVVLVSNGEDAIKECMSNQFDIVLMDIMLKNSIDGVQILKKIKEVSSYKKIPIVAITALAMKGDKENFLNQSFDGYLAKPFIKTTLLGYIQQFLPPA
jgi:CheY-like chemotaxis protein